MLEIAADLLPLLRRGESVAVVTVTAVPRSAPRGAGAAMAVTADGRIIGSISGGCVEGDAVLLAHAALRSGRAEAARFGFSDATAHAAGLACGGTVDVIAHRITPGDADAMAALEAAAADRAVVVGLVVNGPEVGRVLGAEALGRLSSEGDLRDRSGTAITGIRARAYDGFDVLVVARAPRPRLVILGAGEHAAALCRVGSAAGWAVTVCDAWEVLVTAERFPEADRLVTAFPHEYLRSLSTDPDAGDIDARTAICVLTHDERLDVPALRAALAMPVGFVGAMGARSTVARRAALLRQSGVAEADLDRLHSPLGLDLGGASPDETALSVLAEITASRYRRTGLPLRDLHGALHGPAESAPDGAREGARTRAPDNALDGALDDSHDTAPGPHPDATATPPAPTSAHLGTSCRVPGAADDPRERSRLQHASLEGAR